MARISKMKARKYSKRRGRGRGRRMRRGTGVPDVASLTESIRMTDGTVGTVYNNNDVQLAMFDRASAVAQGYQFFRIKKVTWQYKPLLDTFLSTGNTQVPYLYWVINKAGTEYPALDVDWFVANGAKPIRFDDKTISIKYAPAAVLDVIEAGVPAGVQQPNKSVVSPWLLTTKDAFLVQAFAPSQVSHTGHYLLIESPGSTVPMTYQLTLTAEFEFKKPNAKTPSGGLTVEYPIRAKDVSNNMIL